MDSQLCPEFRESPVLGPHQPVGKGYGMLSAVFPKLPHKLVLVEVKFRGFLAIYKDHRNFILELLESARVLQDVHFTDFERMVLLQPSQLILNIFAQVTSRFRVDQHLHHDTCGF
jgi:hypothetical protein